MESREEHVSPDGVLRLLVLRENGEITLGFDGFRWHTHGDVLVGDYALRGHVDLSPEEATVRFVRDVLGNRAIIAVARVHGQLHDVWVTHDPARERKYQPEGEDLVFRLWDGTIFGAS